MLCQVQAPNVRALNRSVSGVLQSRFTSVSSLFDLAGLSDSPVVDDSAFFPFCLSAGLVGGAL